jgi:hypothetical protein
MSNELKYTVKSPNERFKNKTYTEWVQLWSNWFYQSNPDHNNNGDVVFLRGLPLTGGNYADEGVVMVGNNSLEISADQPVLIPIIMSNFVADSTQTSDWLYGMVRSHILGGDHPPHKEQLRINGKPMHDGNPDDDSLGEYDIETPVFMISIPDAPVGMSLKHQIQNPIEATGFFPSVTRGYFVMLQLNAGENYVIESYATGATTEYGPYHTSMLYHIFVKEAREQKQPNIPPSRLCKIMSSKLNDLEKKGEIDPTDLKTIKDFVDTSNDKMKDGMSRSKKKRENKNK